VYTVPVDLLNTSATFRSNSATDVTATIGCVSAAVPTVPFAMLIMLIGGTLLTAVVLLARRREAHQLA
jgi:hypothetical protein